MDSKDLITKSPRWDFMLEHGGKIAGAVDHLVRTVYATDVLDAKTRELVFLGIQTALGLEGPVQTHTQRALMAGCSREEILAAMMLSVVNGGVGGVIKCLPVAVEVIDRWEDQP